MNKLNQASSRSLLSIGFLVVGISSLLSLVVLTVRAIEKVKSGKGLDTFRTMWLVEGNYIGFLIFLAALALACLFAAFMKFREYREWRKLEKRYPYSTSGTR